ncbi:MAG: ABC transporter ATP-binding protein [Chthoniobacterales bacterium]|nr:ABC transporter ATP-binding protein [Chthoniobacterales bacterium]
MQQPLAGCSPQRQNSTTTFQNPNFLEIQDLTKKYGSYEAVRQVSLTVNEGEFFTLVGPSGSGKTTLLRMLVGMEAPTSGVIKLKGSVINNLPPNKRPTCMVFQTLALFPHMSVGLNVEFPMQIRGLRESERRTRAWELLKMLHLDPNKYYEKFPSQCSGGERQRVALARALAYNPEILFFDEPLSAIDAQLRKILQKELKDIQRTTGKTFFYVTHSLEEAMVMSDRLAILRAGQIEQIGSPHEIYSYPKNAFVASFMGEVNLLDIVGTGNSFAFWELRRSRFLIHLPETLPSEQKAKLLIRPENLRFSSTPQASPANSLPGRILNEFLIGSRKQFHFEVESGTILTVERLREEPIPTPVNYVYWEPHESQILNS